MSKRRTTGQRRAEKVLARTKRRRGAGALCGGSGRSTTDVTAPETAPDSRAGRAPDALDALLEFEGVHGVSMLIHDAVMAAVARTLEEGSADAGERLAGRLRDLDDDYAETPDLDEHCRCCDLYVDPDDGPSAWAETDLVRTLMAARDRWRGDPGPASAIVAWVAAHLGRSGPVIERRGRHVGLRAVPESRSLADLDVDTLVRDAVQRDVAELVWLVAGLVAVAGGGEVGWLEQPSRRGTRRLPG